MDVLLQLAGRSLADLITPCAHSRFWHTQLDRSFLYR